MLLFSGRCRSHAGGPEYYSYRDRDIERMLGAVLWYFQGEVGCIYGVLGYSGNFIAENESVSAAFLRVEIFQRNRVDGLFYTHDRVTFVFQPFYDRKGFL